MLFRTLGQILLHFTLVTHQAHRPTLELHRPAAGGHYDYSVPVLSGIGFTLSKCPIFT